ncbi:MULTISPECIES: EipA family protein [Agrobacterium]|nr:MULTISPECIES: EipA family protein [Agrobacterium]
MTMRLNELRTIARLGLVKIFVILASLSLSAAQASAQSSDQYTIQEIVDAGHGFFGETTGGLAKVVERAFQQYGLPNGYILGQEGSGAFVAGLTYGEGTLYTKNAGQHPVFWQGPSLGLDYGGQGTRAMMLVYNLPSVNALYRRYGGVSGSAFIVAGVGMTVLKNSDVTIAPIRTGIGARLGINVGYLKLTPQPTWNPF